MLWLPTTLPGFNTVPQPTSTSSPSMAPNFFIPVSICPSGDFTTTSFLSDFTLEVLPKISDFIVKLGETLPADEYDKVGENVWIAKSAKVFESAYIHGPAIIGKDAEVRHCAFIRGNAIVGEGAVVGNSTELKNVILFNKVQVPHYNYVGDSVLYHTRLPEVSLPVLQ